MSEQNNMQEEQALEMAEAHDAASAESAAPAQTAEQKPRGLSPNAKKELREWIVSLAFALIAVFIIRTFLFTVIRVDGQSMETTLHDNERMIVTVLDMKLGNPERGDVVITHYPGRVDKNNRPVNFVKRVIGVPGDIVWMTGGVTYVNTKPIDEPYVAEPDMRPYGPYTVPEGHYFVMGDNRNHSNDSRFEPGYIPRDMFIGKVRFVMWPLNQVRAVN